MPRIEHVIVLVMENRSFDHMLGFLPHPNPRFDGLLRGGGPFTNPGFNGGPPVPAAPTAKTVIPMGPDHTHDGVMEQLAIRGSGSQRRATNEGFVTSYEMTNRRLNAPAFEGLLGPLRNWLQSLGPRPNGVAGRGPLVMSSQPPENVPVLSTLATEFAVCTRWFCSVPGETWPNRNYVHAATSDGETNIETRAYTDRTIFELLEENGQDWHIYHDDTPQVWAFPRLWDTPERHARWFEPADFAKHLAAGSLPAYSFMEPNHAPPIHTLDHAPVIGEPDRSDNQHPENNLVTDAAYDAFVPNDTDFRRGESLIASVYEALRAHPEMFEKSLLVITHDEHGGFYDHVGPPLNVPAPGDPASLLGRVLKLLVRKKSSSFDFHTLGPRVPTVIVSPLIAAGTVDDVVRDHAAVPSTLRALFAPAAAPLTRRDAWSPPFHTVAGLDQPRRGSDLPDLSAYVRAPSRGAAEAAAGNEKRDVPEHFAAFARQAELVYEHLQAVGEPEVSGFRPNANLQDASDITRIFQAAASRHRQEGHQ